jgi:hypothetical protein
MSKRKAQDSSSSQEKRLKVTTNHVDTHFKLDNLPIKAIEIILMKLRLKEAVKLRLLNKNLKKIFDECKILWEKKIRVSINLNNVDKIQKLLALMRSAPFIDDISIKCPNELPILDDYPNNPYAQPRVDMNNQFIEPNVTVELKDLHMSNLSVANLFSHSCDTLIISNFNEDLVRRHNDELQTVTGSRGYIQIQYARVKLKLLNLRKLCICAAVDEPGIDMDCYEPLGTACADLMHSVIKKSKINLSNLKELFITDFHAHCSILLDCLRGLTLDCLKIDCSRSIQVVDSSWRRKSQFIAKKVWLDCSVNVMHALLFHGIKLDQVEELQLRDNGYYNEDEDAYTSFFRRINNKLKNCRKFGILLNSDLVEEGKLKMPTGQLKDIEFGCTFNTNELASFLNGYLAKSNFNGLEIIRLTASFEPNDKTDENNLKSILSCVRKYFTNLKEFRLYLNPGEGEENFEKDLILTPQKIDNFDLAILYN